MEKCKIIQDDWCPEFQEQHFLLVKLNCDESQGVSGIQMLEDFLQSIAWAVVTGQTEFYTSRAMGKMMRVQEKLVGTSVRE
jgi:hypothetical protein